MALQSLLDFWCNFEITGHDTKRILHYRLSLKRNCDAGWRWLLAPLCLDVTEQNKSGDPPLNSFEKLTSDRFWDTVMQLYDIRLLLCDGKNDQKKLNCIRKVLEAAGVWIGRRRPFRKLFQARAHRIGSKLARGKFG